jgi:Cu/Ag efflux pump CusA
LDFLSLSLADIRRDVGPNMISRENVQRKIVVQSNVAGRDVGSVVEEIRDRVARQVSLPPDYYVEYGGQFESAEQATRRIILLSLLSLAAILLLLFMEFRSVRQTLLVMVNLPLALVGGVFAVLVTGGVLNIATLVGFITLFGIAVRNGILMVSHYNRLLSEGEPLREVVWRGSMERLNPVFMTALTAGLALLPLALAGGEPGNEIQSPLAVVVLGGLLTSLALNMVVVPVLYLRYGVAPAGRGPARPGWRGEPATVRQDDELAAYGPGRNPGVPPPRRASDEGRDPCPGRCGSRHPAAASDRAGRSVGSGQDLAAPAVESAR